MPKYILDKNSDPAFYIIKYKDTGKQFITISKNNPLETILKIYGDEIEIEKKSEEDETNRRNI